MASPVQDALPTLMTLPRELRDTIYSHLHREIQYPFPFKNNFRRLQCIDIDLTFTNAPCVNVLLTSRQLSVEYGETLQHRRLSAAMTMKPTAEADVLDFRPRDTDPVMVAISHLHDATFFYPCEGPWRPFWRDAHGFVREISLVAPRLRTVQIATRLGSPDTIPLQQGALRPGLWETYEAATPREFRLQPPPRRLVDGYGGEGDSDYFTHDLKLRARGEGYQLGFVERRRFGHAEARGESDVTVIECGVARVAAYAYAKVEDGVELMDWRGISEHWPMPEVPRDMLAVFGEGEEGFGKLTQGVQHWKITYGDEVDERRARMNLNRMM